MALVENCKFSVCEPKICSVRFGIFLLCIQFSYWIGLFVNLWYLSPMAVPSFLWLLFDINLLISPRNGLDYITRLVILCCLSAPSGSEALGSIGFLDVNTFLLCSLSGRLMLADIRQSGIAFDRSLALSASGNSQWIAAVRPEHPGIASLSSEGHITITDSRDLGAPFKCARGRISEPSTSESFMCICWAPRLDHCVSISGMIQRGLCVNWT